MPAPFSRSLRSIESDGHGRALGWLVVAALLLAVWGVWFARARVSLRATSVAGRVVVDRAVFPVHATVGGRVAEMPGLELGARVARGDVLVALDTAAERLRIAEERARIAGLGEERASVERRLGERAASLEEARGSDVAALEEARAHLSALELDAQLADEEHQRLSRLFEMGGVSELEHSRARIEALRAKSAIDGYRFSLQRLELDQRRLAHDRAAEVEALRGELTQLDGRIATATASIRRIEHEIAERTLTAPADGELAEVATLGAGSYLESGARVAAVVSAARLEVVAEFTPEQALGRLHPGQPARLRFAGFPWSRYGVVHARVESVGREARDGRIQVELSVDDETPTEIPLQHGLACSVEVDIASVSPAELVLRSAGRTPAAERAALGPR